MENKKKLRTYYRNPKQLRTKLESYFNHCKSVNEVPTIIGMIIFLEISENTISEWKRKQKDTFLQQLNWAYLQIKHLNLQRLLKANPNASTWYLERAFQKEFSLTTKIDLKSDGNTTPIVIQLENKGKNKI